MNPSFRPSMMATPPKLIIFDFDGTLVETEILIARIIAEKLARLGSTVSPGDVAATLAGVPRAGEQALLESLAGIAVPDAFMDEAYVQWHTTMEAGIVPTPGAVETLKTLSIPFCVASNTSRKDLILRMRAAGIFGLIGPRFFSSHDIGRHKPDPAVFLLAAEAMGFDPADCLVIEDSVTGLTAAKNARMRCCAFVGAGHQSERMHAALKGCEPDGVLWNIADLWGMLGSQAT